MISTEAKPIELHYREHQNDRYDTIASLMSFF